MTIANISQHSRPLGDIWESKPNNDFAAHLFTLLDWDRVVADIEPITGGPCRQCELLESARLFEMRCDISKLQNRATETACPVCGLLLEALESRGFKSPQTVILRQNQGVLGIENGPDLLSIYMRPGTLKFIWRWHRFV